jgi:hypothetical protein
MTGNATSPEFLLVGACCRWPPSVERAAAIGAAANEVSDWVRFLRLIEYAEAELDRLAGARRLRARSIWAGLR